jgi:hypothetical protein
VGGGAGADFNQRSLENKDESRCCQKCIETKVYLDREQQAAEALVLTSVELIAFLASTQRREEL